MSALMPTGKRSSQPGISLEQTLAVGRGRRRAGVKGLLCGSVLLGLVACGTGAGDLDASGERTRAAEIATKGGVISGGATFQPIPFSALSKVGTVRQKTDACNHLWTLKLKSDGRLFVSKHAGLAFGSAWMDPLRFSEIVISAIDVSRSTLTLLSRDRTALHTLDFQANLAGCPASPVPLFLPTPTPGWQLPPGVTATALRWAGNATGSLEAIVRLSTSQWVSATGAPLPLSGRVVDVVGLAPDARAPWLDSRRLYALHLDGSVHRFKTGMDSPSEAITAGLQFAQLATDGYVVLGRTQSGDLYWLNQSEADADPGDGVEQPTAPNARPRQIPVPGHATVCSVAQTTFVTCGTGEVYELRRELHTQQSGSFLKSVDLQPSALNLVGARAVGGIDPVSLYASPLNYARGGGLWVSMNNGEMRLPDGQLVSVPQ